MHPLGTIVLPPHKVVVGIRRTFLHFNQVLLMTLQRLLGLLGSGGEWFVRFRHAETITPLADALSRIQGHTFPDGRVCRANLSAVAAHRRSSV